MSARQRIPKVSRRRVRIPPGVKWVAISDAGAGKSPPLAVADCLHGVAIDPADPGFEGTECGVKSLSTRVLEGDWLSLDKNLFTSSPPLSSMDGFPRFDSLSDLSAYPHRWGLGPEKIK